MEKKVTHFEAWIDFFAWIKNTSTWAHLSKYERAYIGKANVDFNRAALGPVRIRTILERYGNGRYTFTTTVIIKE